MKRIKRIGPEFIDTAAGVIAFEHRLRRSQIMLVGFDTEYDPGKSFQDKKETENVRKRNPLLMSLCLVTPERGEGRHGFVGQGYVFDLRKAKVRDHLKFLRKISMKVVGHFLETDLITLTACDISFFGASFYDTFLAAKYMELGIGHPDLNRELDRIEGATDDPIRAEIECGEYEKEYFERRYSLENVGRRCGIRHLYLDSKGRLQHSFIGMSDDSRFTQEQIDYAFEDAHISCEIYLAQIESLMGHGTQTYLEQVVFPLIPHLASNQWLGAKVAINKLAIVHERVRRCAEAKKLFMKEQYCLENFRSHTRRKAVLAKLDLLPFVTKRNGKVSLDKKKVKELKDRHPYFKDHLQMSHFESTQSSIEKILDLTDDEGFIHPKFHQLQAKTGRVTTTRPSPFDKLLRPIIVPSRPGYGIFEMDIGQAEVWLIACMSGDLALQRACDSYDVYLKLGLDIVPSWFDVEDAKLIVKGPTTPENEEALKRLKDVRYHDLRNKLLKPLILAILYGQTPKTVAKNTKQKLSFIQTIFEKLEKTYPELFHFIRENIKYGSHRGYIELRGGFRIHVAGANNEINRHRNNPIQGMCAALFNRALLYAYEAAPRFEARLLFPLYDAVVVEAPLVNLESCATAMKEIFINVFQGAFPEAIARVKMDINDVAPYCWNEDGASDSLEDIPIRRERPTDFL